MTPCSSCMAIDLQTEAECSRCCVCGALVLLCRRPLSIHSVLQCVVPCQMVHVASNSVKIGGAQIFSCIVMSEFLTALAGAPLNSAKVALTFAHQAPYFYESHMRSSR